MSELADLLDQASKLIETHDRHDPLTLGGAFKMALGHDRRASISQLTIPERQLLIGGFTALELSFDTKYAFGQWMAWASTQEVALHLASVAHALRQQERS